MNKATNCTKAVEMIPEGATLMIGGFLGVGTPNRLIDELVRQGKKDLTVIANDTGRPAAGIGKLIVAKLVKKAIVSHIGTNRQAVPHRVADTRRFCSYCRAPCRLPGQSGVRAYGAQFQLRHGVLCRLRHCRARPYCSRRRHSAGRRDHAVLLRGLHRREVQLTWTKK